MGRRSSGRICWATPRQKALSCCVMLVSWLGWGGCSGSVADQQSARGDDAGDASTAWDAPAEESSLVVPDAIEEEGSAPCGPESCAGCCADSTTCVEGNQDATCGTQGEACRDCLLLGETCSPTFHGCETRVPCGSCAGCCRDDTDPPNCELGVFPEACGTNGAVCESCGAGPCMPEQVGGTCELPTTCGWWNCLGCCDHSTSPPRCRTGLDDDACGAQGADCANCAGSTCLETQSGGLCSNVASTCAGMTCGGCCDSEGRCLVGDAPDACGLHGGACLPCPPDHRCEAAPVIGGECMPNPTCNPAQCKTGCCAPNGDCVAGTNDGSCGGAGSACVACAEGQTCVPTADGGACSPELPCSPTTCPTGCCDALGQCRVGEGGHWCGSHGAACTDCTAANLVCNKDQDGCAFAKPCDWWSCPGCCTPWGRCRAGTADHACGSQGAVCQNCSMAGTTCEAGSCKP